MNAVDCREDLEIKKSPIAGRGLFATRAIARGSVVLVWHPKILSQAEAKALRDDEQNFLIPEGNHVLWMQPPERYMNHSCQPNTHAIGHSDIALRDIQPGEEITSHYIDQETENFECRCGRANCRNPN